MIRIEIYINICENSGRVFEKMELREWCNNIRKSLFDYNSCVEKEEWCE